MRKKKSWTSGEEYKPDNIIPISKFAKTRCPVCGEELTEQRMSLYNGKYHVSQKDLWVNVGTGMKIIVHAECKQEFAINFEEYFPNGENGEKNDEG